MVYIVKQVLAELDAADKTFESIYTIMRRHFHAETFGEQIFGIRIEKTTYDDLYALCERVAAGIAAAHGAGDGSRFIGLYLPNSPLWVACFWGTLMAGYAPLLLNTMQTPAETEAVLAATDPVTVLTDGSWTGTLAEKADYPAAAYTPVTWGDEIALLTSGTTGDPKVVLYHGAAICAQMAISGGLLAQNKTVRHDRKLGVKLLAFLPFYHIFGLMATLMWFTFFGRTLVFIRDNDPRTIRFACVRHGVTHFFAVPLVWDTVASSVLSEAEKQGKRRTLDRAIDFSNALQNAFPLAGGWFVRHILLRGVRRQVLGGSVHFCISGGSFVKEETRRVLNGLGYRLYIGYGLTEAGIVSVELSLRAKQRLKDTVGRPFSIVDCRLDEQGVLCLGSPVLCHAVIENGVRRERTGELVTRDLGRIGADGRLEILGRVDDTVIGAGGENLSPALIEQELDAPSAEAFCAIGLPDETGNDRLAVIVRYSEGMSAAAVADSINRLYDTVDALPLSRRPAAVFLASGPLPATAIGKVKRTALKAALASGKIALTPAVRRDAAAVERLRDEAYEQTLLKVRAVFAKVLGKRVEEIGEHDHFVNDLGGDSLRYYALMNELSETFRISLTLDASAPVTPAQFAARLNGEASR